MTPNKRRVTLKDIAQKTGYAVNTVSKALRDAPDLAADTKQAICRVADEMGYIANSSANSLRSGRSHVLALIVADITNPLFAITAKELETAARELDYTLLVMNTDEEPENEIKAVRSAIGRGVDGVMLFQTEKTGESLELLQRAGVPCVLMHRVSEGQQADAVLMDEELGGYLAGRALIERGCEKMVMLTVPSFISSSQQREKGFMRAMHEAGVSGARCGVVHLDSVLDGCENAVRTMFSGPERPDGIFCFSDITAFETACVLREMGLKAGEDVALIGFDNIQSKLNIPFGLTTISVHKTAQAHAALRLLMRRISGDWENYPEHVKLPVHFVKRESA